MLSAVAGIVDKRGGLRVVVTQRWRMRNHVLKGEKLFVVPGLEVREPVPWDDIPPLIETVQKHVVSQIAPVNHCGDCRACCFILYIKEGPFQKPSNHWCQNCAANFGCKIYQQRPSVCRSFKCEWLRSQDRNDRMELELRPDKCGVIFTEDTQGHDPLVFEVHGDPGDVAWRYINEMQRAGYKAKKVTHYIGEKE